MKAEANRLIAYHAPISKALTHERTSLESALIPVTAYIVVACAEAYLRYPEMMRRIDPAAITDDTVDLDPRDDQQHPGGLARGHAQPR